MHQVPPAMTQPPNTARGFAKKRLAVIVAGGLAGVAIGLAGVYGIGALTRNAGVEPACLPAAETARHIRPLARGEVAALAVAATPRRLPELTFQDATGQSKTLADWRGRIVLFNLWATWCVPCRREMPALDALQNTLGGPDFDIVAVNIDTRDTDKPKAWLKEVGVNRLAYYADASAKVFQDLKVAGKALGMPTTILIDRAGCELGTIAGPAEWASEDAIRLVRAALRK
jgi:thiol-disulfide isomerase/thioredoxin